MYIVDHLEGLRSIYMLSSDKSTYVMLVFRNLTIHETTDISNNKFNTLDISITPTCSCQFIWNWCTFDMYIKLCSIFMYKWQQNNLLIILVWYQIYILLFCHEE